MNAPRVADDREGLADVAGSATGGELVVGVVDLGYVGAFAGKLGEGALDLAPDTADGDAEDTLSALQQVDDLAGRAALVDARTVAHQRDLGQVVGAALAQMRDGGPDLLQRDAGVEQALDDLEQQHVTEGVEPLGAGAAGATHTGLDQTRSGPVVELPVGHAGRGTGGRAAESHVLGHRGQVVGEQQTLLGRVGGSLRRVLRRGGIDVRASVASAVTGALPRVGESSPDELQRRHSLLTVRPGQTAVNDRPGGSYNLNWRLRVEGSALVLEVLGLDLIEEFPELLDLGLVLVGHLHPGLTEDVGTAADPASSTQGQRDRVRRTGVDLDTRREHQTGEEHPVLDVGDADLGELLTE